MVWWPNHNAEETLGRRVQFEFPAGKLLDLVAAAEQAAQTGRPSAVVILPTGRRNERAGT